MDKNLDNFLLFTTGRLRTFSSHFGSEGRDSLSLASDTIVGAWKFTKSSFTVKICVALTIMLHDCYWEQLLEDKYKAMGVIFLLMT